MRALLGACCRVLVLCAVALLASRAAVADTVTPQDAIVLLEGFEAKIRIIEYKCELSSGKFENREALSNFLVRNAEMASSSVRWDFERNRYFAHIDAIQPAVTQGKTQAGKPLYYSSQSEFSNDTKVFQTWYRGVVADEFPVIPDQNVKIHQSGQQGLVSASSEEAMRQQGVGFLAIRSLQIGFGWVPHNAWSRHEPPQKLSEFLRNKLEGGDVVTVQATEPGEWLIHVISTKTSRMPYEWKLLYDPERGRPLKAEWGSTTSDNSLEWNVSTRAMYEYETDADLCPKRVVLVEMLGVPRGYEWIYRDVVINRTVADLDFQLTFPAGVEVTDYVSKGTYIVGKSVVDDEEAVQRFMESEGLKPPVQIPAPRVFSKRLLLLNVAVLAIVVVAIVWHRYGRRAASCFVACVVMGSSATAQETARSLPGVQREATGGQLHTRQCGFLATIFMLKYFDVEYKINVLQAAMVPDENGVKLGDIANVLRAYGLNVQIREKVSVSDVSRMVGRGMLALVPIVLKNGRGHYLIAMKHPHSGKQVVVDVLTHVETLDRGLSESQIQEQGGVVAFVSRSVAAVRTGANVRFLPQSVDIGEVRPGDLALREVKLEIENLSEFPTIVEEIRTSCGCTSPNWRQGILMAKEKRGIVFEVSPVGWERGLQKKTVRAEISGGAVANAEIVGTGIDAQQLQGIRVASNRIEIDATDQFVKGDDTEIVAQEFVVSSSVARLVNLRVTSDSDWLDYRVTRSKVGDVDSDGESEIGIVPVVRLTEISRVALAAGSRRATGRLLVVTNTEELPVELFVAVVRKRLVSANATVVEIASAGAPGTVDLEDVGAVVCTQLELKSVKCSPEGIRFTASEAKESRISVRIEAESDASKRTYLVTFEVERSAPRSIDLLSLIVRVH